MTHFWSGFFKQASASGAMYHRDLATDMTIHSMQEDTYPEGSYSFFDPEGREKRKITGSTFFEGDSDPVESSNAGQPPRWLGVDTFTLGHAEPG